MRYGRVVTFLAGLLLGLLPLAGGVAATSAEPQRPTEIQLRVETPAYTLDAAGLHVAGYAVHGIPGAPALPVWTTIVRLPLDGAWELTYASSDQRVLALTDPLPAVSTPLAALDGPLSPAEIAERVAQVTWVDRPDPAIYGADALYPAHAVQAGPEGWARGQRLLPVRVFPFQVNPVTGELHYHPDLRITIAVAQSESGHGAEAEHREDIAQSEISFSKDDAQAVLRVYTGERGLYRLTYEDLAGAGVPVDDLDPASLAMSYLGEPIASEVRGGEDGRFDPGDLVVFYAEPYQGRYMVRNVYRLTYGGAAGERIVRRSVTPTGAEPVITAITHTAHIEFDRSYYSTYELPRDADHWFDNPLYASAGAPVVTVTYALPLNDPLTDGNMLVRALLHGGFNDEDVNPNQAVSVALNGRPAGLFQWQGSRLHLVEKLVPAAWLQPIGNQLSLTAALAQLPGLTGYWVSPDWVEVSYPALPSAKLDRLYIEGFAVAGQTARIDMTGFSNNTVRAYDVRNPRRPAALNSLFVEYNGSSFTAQLWDAWPVGDPAPSYALSTDAALLAPLAIEPDAPTVWRSPDNAADYIAIVHRSLWDGIQPLLDHRAAEGLRVVKVDVQDIYDEFSGGRIDPEAIRSFLAYAYANWNNGATPPQYVLLVGDGHYDFKGAARPDLPNLIPPYLLHIDPWIGETAADNRYVSVDGPEDFLPDMAIGRIPAKSPADVKAVVDKTLAYEATVGDGTSSLLGWRTRAVFVADDRNEGFDTYSDVTRLSLPPTITSQTIYYRSNPATDTATEMRAAIRAAFNAGALYLQWFGHASRQRWGSVSMFDVLDPRTLAANAALPFTAHYSCWSGYFINIQSSGLYGNSELTLSEALLLTPGRGAVADFSPSGLHVGPSLVVLNRGVARAIFDERIARIGLAVNAAKLEVFAKDLSSVDLIDTQVFFGDPATRLRLPSQRTHLPLIVVGQ